MWEIACGEIACGWGSVDGTSAEEGRGQDGVRQGGVMSGEIRKVCRGRGILRLEDRETGGCGSKKGRRREGDAGEEARERSEGWMGEAGEDVRRRLRSVRVSQQPVAGGHVDIARYD